MACDTREVWSALAGSAAAGLGRQKARLDEQQDIIGAQQGAINALLRRVTDLERVRAVERNPLEAFEEDALDAAPLLAEVGRLTKENRDLRDALRDAHQNAEALVLVTKQVIGRGE